MKGNPTGLSAVIASHFIDVLDWVEDEPGVLCFRFPTKSREIVSGAELTVREGQVAIFLNEGEVVDVLIPGRYTLSTKTLPILAAIRKWDKSFKSPFKSDVFFLSLREQMQQRWGTRAPLTYRDPELGPLRIRAHGTYSYRIRNPILFFQRVNGSKEKTLIADVEDQLRSAILTGLGAFLASSKVPFLDMASSQLKFSSELKNILSGAFSGYGLSLESFLVEGISLPPELQQYFDKAASMRLIGDLKKYLLFQAAENFHAVASGAGGASLGHALGSLLTQAGKEGAPPPAQADVEKTLQTLNDLLTQGLLTPEEFAKKSAQLLGKK